MATMNINNATTLDYTSKVTDTLISAAETDGATGQKEYEWSDPDCAQKYGYFTSIPDLRSAILLKASWIVGQGYTSSTETEIILSHITGWGKDTFQDILFSMQVCKRVYGNAYAEIIKDKKSGMLLNLKVLDPSTMKHVVNSKGQLIRFEQTSKIDKAVRKFDPEDIFYLANNRTADEIHGRSDIDSVQNIINAAEQAFRDFGNIMHNQARPMLLWKLKTDDTTKISTFVARIKAARANDTISDIFIPDDENIVTVEPIQVNPSQLIINWREDLRNSFYRTIMLPQIVPGAGGQSTESEAKTIYLAFENIIAKEQIELEKQIWQQLYLEIELIEPTSLEANMQNDETKNVMGFQPSEMMAGRGD